MKSFLTHIIAAIVVIATIFTATVIALNIATRHNEEIRVPDFSGMTLNEAILAAHKAQVRIDVTDSVYIGRMPRGSVFAQNPSAGSHVKQGRRIMVTINAVLPKKVAAPDLLGCSLRQAKSELASRGLRVGRLIYVRDIATNNVLGQECGGKKLVPGTQIESGKHVDLTLGLNAKNNLTFMPNVLGMKYMRAIDVVTDNSLNVDMLKFDRTVKTYSDSLNAVVFKQEPAVADTSLLIGTDIALWLTTDVHKVPKPEEE